MSFIGTGFREIGLKIRRQRTRIALRHEKRLLQKSEINLGREGTAQAANFPELRNEIVALKKLEQEQKEVALRIAQIEEGIKKIEEERQQNAREQSQAITKLEAEKKPLLQKRNQTKSNVDVCERELAAIERRIQESEAADRDLLKQLSDLQALDPVPADVEDAICEHQRAEGPPSGRARRTCAGATWQRGGCAFGQGEIECRGSGTFCGGKKRCADPE